MIDDVFKNLDFLISILSIIFNLLNKFIDLSRGETKQFLRT